MKTPRNGWKPRFFHTLVLAAVLLAGLLSGCGSAPSAGAAEGPRDECGLYEPSAADVEKTLTFGLDAFNANDWVKSYSVEPYKITLTRRNDTAQAIAYSEYLIFTCGYTQEDMNNYFNDEGFSIIFADYESYALGNFCEKSGVSLYEYDLVDEGTPFKARYWVKQDTDTRILVYMLVFPEATPGVLDEFSKKIFPSLAACP
ncbi:MAG: hypothetical protein HY869_20020 [Chloroflexi bacterium]|nr:hypothetical protein [Chloroflexota bacterium]